MNGMGWLVGWMVGWMVGCLVGWMGRKLMIFGIFFAVQAQVSYETLAHEATEKHASRMDQILRVRASRI